MENHVIPRIPFSYCSLFQLNYDGRRYVSLRCITYQMTSRQTRSHPLFHMPGTFPSHIFKKSREELSPADMVYSRFGRPPCVTVSIALTAASTVSMSGYMTHAVFCSS